MQTQPETAQKTTHLAEHILLAGCALLPALSLTVDRWLGLPLGMPWETAWLRSDFLIQTGLPAWSPLALLCITAAFYIFTRLPQRDAVPNPPVDDSPSTPANPERQRTARILLGAAALGAAASFIGGLTGRTPGGEILIILLLYLAGRLLPDLPPKPFQSLPAWLLPGAAFHLTLILTLRSLATGFGALPVWGITLLLSVWLLWPHRKSIPLIWWIFNAAMVLYTIGINNWRFAIVGDEYPFFLYGLNILEKQSPGTVFSNFFRAQVVYERFTYLSSLLQAVSMALLGKDSFGWRFGGIYLAALSIPLLYDFSKAYLHQRTALIFAALMAVSHYLMNFSKVGYNNMQALFLLSLLLWLGGKAARSGRTNWLTLLGAAAGLCFYVYPLALIALPLPFLLLYLHRKPGTGRPSRRWLLVIAPLTILLLPLFFQPGYWQTLVSASVIQSYDPRLHLSHFFANLLAAFSSFFYAPTQTHFVAAAWLDPVSAALAVIGLAWTMRQARRETFARFLLLAFLFLLIGAGAIHDRALPIVPHMFLVLPCFLLLAALGIEWLLQTLPKPKVPVFGVILGVLGIVFLAGLNFVQAYTLNLTQADAYFEEERIFLRLMQRDAAHETINDRSYLYFTSPDTQLQLVYALQQAYHLPPAPAQIIHIPVEEIPEFSTYMIHLLRDENSVAILGPGLEASLRGELERELVSHGKAPCVVQRDPLSAPAFIAFIFEKHPLLCPERGNWGLDR
ncbi:MAG: glycosyltransferase family 39 protein [Anaerolineaceae bacterium]|jgi:hypothetical protein|nr:glycosyltransferase family 39 protein [Anaerolineaceae bacterium]